MPSLESQFELRDIVKEQFADMAEVICYLSAQLDYIEAGRAKDPRLFAKQAREGMKHIFVPVQFIPIQKPKEP